MSEFFALGFKIYIFYLNRENLSFKTVIKHIAYIHYLLGICIALFSAAKAASLTASVTVGCA